MKMKDFMPLTALLSMISIAYGEPVLPDAWSGGWMDGDGGVISVRRLGRFLDVSGKDAYSIYHSVCLLSADGEGAECSGHGSQIELGHRFLYHSRWRLENGSIKEAWEARLASGVLRGELTFERINKDQCASQCADNSVVLD